MCHTTGNNDETARANFELSATSGNLGRMKYWKEPVEKPRYFADKKYLMIANGNKIKPKRRFANPNRPRR